MALTLLFAVQASAQARKEIVYKKTATESLDAFFPRIIREAADSAKSIQNRFRANKIITVLGAGDIAWLYPSLDMSKTAKDKAGLNREQSMLMKDLAETLMQRMNVLVKEVKGKEKRKLIESFKQITHNKFNP